MVHHKAQHREWQPDAAHAAMYEDEEIPEPETFDDDYQNRSAAAAAARMRMEDLQWKDLKADVPPACRRAEERSWRYQRYIKDYLRVVAAVDDNVGRLLDYLDREGLTEDTLVIYTSDQGFFLGDHGWFDKRFMYEESLRMPFVARLPREVKAGTTCDEFVLNVDFAPLFLDLAGVTIPRRVPGPLLPAAAARRHAPRLAAVHVLPLLDARRRRHTTSTPTTACAPTATS